jgi:DNA repair protein RadC
METNYENNVPMNCWAEDDIPSSKMLLRGSMNLSDAELLSIIIGTGIAGENSLDIARNMLSRYGNNLNEFWKCSISDLQKIKGIGHKQAVRMCAMFAISRRRNESEVISKDKITCSTHAFQIFHSIIGDLPYEEFWILLLNKGNKVIKKSRISEGGISGTIVDPKKIFHVCIENHATSIILGHNHPSGNLDPSEADKKITQQLINAGKLLEIAVLDHIIVGDNSFYSFADSGLFS